MGEGFWAARPVFVTGGTGFLGSHLVAELVRRGADVLVLRRDARPATSIVAGWSAAVTTVAGDVLDADAMAAALARHDVQTVFHLAAQSQVSVAGSAPTGTFETNIAGGWALLEACRRAQSVREVVVASSDKAYGRQPTLPYVEDMPLLASDPYNASKACLELLARTYAASYGTPVAITRCANLYGPGDRNWRRLVPGTLASILRGEPPVIRSDGSQVRDYLYVADGVAAYLVLAEALAERPELVGEVFNFSAELPLTVLEMVARLQARAGTAFEPIVHGEVVNEIPEQHLSARRAREELGWRATHGLDAGLDATIAYHARLATGADK